MRNDTIIYLIPIVTIIVAFFVIHYYTTYYAPTQYMPSSYYPRYVVSSFLTNPSYAYILYGLNQSNGTACLIKATKLVYKYNYNYTQHVYVLVNQSGITNRSALIDLVNNNPIRIELRIEPGYTLVCPQSDFQN